MADAAVAAAAVPPPLETGDDMVLHGPENPLEDLACPPVADPPAADQPRAAESSTVAGANLNGVVGDGSSSAVLSEPIDVLDGLITEVNEEWDEVPEGVVWAQPRTVTAGFGIKRCKDCTGQACPTAVLLDAANDEDRLKILSWWVVLTRDEQQVLIDRCKAIYKAYTKSNERKGTRRRRRRRPRPSSPVSVADLDRCESLSESIDFFEKFGVDTDDIAMMYSMDKLPAMMDWDDNKVIDATLPLIPGFGIRQNPRALIMDAVTDADKLLVVNWWRLLTVEQQAAWWDKIKSYYQKPKTSNQRKIVTAAQKLGLPSHIGQADAQELLDKAAECSANAAVATVKRRTIKDQALRTSQKRDMHVRSATQTAVRQVDRINNATTDAREETAGFTNSIFIQTTDVASPAKAGFRDSGTILRKRKLAFVRARCAEVMETTPVKASIDAMEAKGYEIRISYMGESPPKVHRPKPTVQGADENDKAIARQFGGSSTVGTGTVVDNMEDLIA